MATSTVEQILSVVCNDKINAKSHHTEKFYPDITKIDDETYVVLRRAANFTWSVELADTFDPENSKLWVLFNHSGDKTAVLPVEVELDPTKLVEPLAKCPADFGAQFTNSGKLSNIEMILPSDASPGEYTVQFGVAPDTTIAKNVSMTFTVSRKIALLCNPWHECSTITDRDVSSIVKAAPANGTESDANKTNRVKNNEGKLESYVTNAVANWWENDVKHTWRLGQFEQSSLSFALELLSKISLPSKDWKTLPEVVASLANLLGTLVLKASENNNVECLEITKKQWRSSSEIIETWQKNKEQLENGQSWMFAGLLTTVLRTLGIGCRLVSASNTGMDLDRTGTIDIKYKRLGPNREFKRDVGVNKTIVGQNTTTPIHVWNELHLNDRPDLVVGAVKFDGWQAIDASASAMIAAFTNNEHAVGPTPLKAIHDGLTIDPAHSNKFNYGKYWYSLLQADILHEFVEVVDGKEKNIGHKFEVNNLVSIIRTEEYHQTNNMLVTENHHLMNYVNDFYSSNSILRALFYTTLTNNQREQDIAAMEKTVNTDIKLELTTLVNMQLAEGDSVNLPMELTNNTLKNQEYRMQYILVNTTTGIVKSQNFDDSWKEIKGGASVPYRATTLAPAYLHELSNPWSLDAYVIATFKNEPKLTTVYHRRFTVVPPKLTIIENLVTPATLTLNTKTYTVSLTNNLPSSMCGCKMTLHVSPSDGVKISRSAGFINSCDFIQPNGKMENEFTVEFPKLADPDEIVYKITASIDCDQLGTIIAKTAVDAKIPALAPSTPSSTMSTAYSSENSSDAEDASDDEDAEEQKKKDDEAYKKRLQDVLAKMKCVQEDKDGVDDGVDQDADADVVKDIKVTTKSSQITTKQQNDTSNPQRFYCADTNIGTICVSASDVVATSPPVPGHDNGNTDVDVVTTQDFNFSQSTVYLDGSGSGVPFKNTSQTKHSGGDVYQLGTDVDQRGNITTRPTHLPHRTGQQSTGGHGDGSQRHDSSGRRDTTVKRCWLTGFPKRTRSHHI